MCRLLGRAVESRSERQNVAGWHRTTCSSRSVSTFPRRCLGWTDLRLIHRRYDADEHLQGFRVGLANADPGQETADLMLQS